MPHATRPGDVLADRYRLVDLLSESGEGRFWRAHDRMLERHVAIHVIRADDPRAEALMAAARRSATVLDPRILRVLDADVTDKVCYVVNEWGWGTSLDIVAAGTGPLGPRRSAWLVAEVADAIATAHRAGVAHGRLNPENVLIDRTGGVRIIGLCVDAALHGVPDIDVRDDLTDLAGVLYCALTARWGGQSGSIVTPAPRDHGEVLRPRRVRAGIPRPLDTLCEELLHSHPHARHREPVGIPTDARGIADYLADFVGDPTGMAHALLSSTPPVLPDEELVVLPQVPELTPHETARTATPSGGTSPDPGRTDDSHDTDDTDDTDGGTGGGSGGDAELPTEAGMPIFGPDGDDVSWLERRSTPAPPPPPFESPPERPLFAPEPADGSPARQARAGTAPPTPTSPVASSPRQRDGYWPWDTNTGTGLGSGLVDGRGLSSSTILPVVEDDRVPGRSWFRLGAILSVVVLLVVAVLVAISLGQGPSGTDDPDEADEATAPPRVASAPVAGVTATAFDPLGTDGFENDDQAGNAVDGDADTSWATQSYNDQLGPPPGLKTGVGLALDLGGERAVTGIDLALLGSPTVVSLYLTDSPPDSVADLEPAASGRAKRPQKRLRLDEPVAASYAVVWLTELPADGSLFRGRIAEVVVQAAAAP
ncbi:MAG: hypothetical protein CMJ44_14910 [Pimelobacter sp.]|nr:hypothetical protein [Pimelobacter sp.]